MLITTFSSFGIWFTFLYPKRSCICARICLSYFSLSRFMTLRALRGETCRFAALGADAVRTFGRFAMTDARGCFALLAHVLKRRERKRSFLLENAAGLRSATHVLLLRT